MQKIHLACIIKLSYNVKSIALGSSLMKKYKSIALELYCHIMKYFIINCKAIEKKQSKVYNTYIKSSAIKLFKFAILFLLFKK